MNAVLHLLIVLHATTAALFNLTIIHTNDIHCRFEEASLIGGSCLPNDAANGNCYGGYARLVTASRMIRNQNSNSIFLHAGDFFQGTR